MTCWSKVKGRTTCQGLRRDLLGLKEVQVEAPSSQMRFRSTRRSLPGIYVTQRGIEANPLKIKAIIDMKAPTCLNEAQRLTGRITALSRIISKSTKNSLPFFKTLRKAKTFEWGNPYQIAFEDLKSYLARLPLLVKPSPGETLYLYLSVAPQAVSSVLIREKQGKQLPIYYVSKVLSGAEERYTLIEKMTLALVVTARRLRPYFLSHPVGVKTNTPLKQTLGKLDTSGRLVKWAVELSEYDISYLPRTAIKAQALADFASEMAEMTIKDASQDQKWLLLIWLLHSTRQWCWHCHHNTTK
ncbi:UNVERIFIED_CONTAM: hypothetical protein Sradi_6851600 [Sesamum radiatum]|uniref:Reverse transcriptase/retrotransposon-derived protein RNase H-like domain-containing protein n=1 Tax=Sesamum radiatum TaxID=300843 RepID=A0AAW2JKS8_SESRA